MTKDNSNLEDILTSLVYDSSGRLPTTKHEMITEATTQINQLITNRVIEARIQENNYADKMVGKYGYEGHFELRKAELESLLKGEKEHE